MRTSSPFGFAGKSGPAASGALRAWVVAAGLLGLVPAAQGSVQDDAASWVRTLRERYRKIDEYFSPEQLDQLGKTAVQKVADVPDAAFRKKLLGDIQDYVADNYMLGGFVHAMPDDNGGQTLNQTVTRTPSSWELFQYDLEKRIDRGIAQPKRDQDQPLIQQQVDQLLQTARTRLYNIITGPQAVEYVDASVERLGKILRTSAGSDLEFGFSAPLTAEQFKEVDHALSSFVPDTSLEPSGARSKSPRTVGTVTVTDAKHPPALAVRIVDLQMFLKAQGLIEGYSAPREFYDDRYRELSRKSSEEIAALCRDIDQKESERFQKRREEMERQAGPSRRPGPEKPAAVPGTGPSTPDAHVSAAAPSGREEGGSAGGPVARQRIAAAVLVLLALGIGLGVWWWRRR